MTAPRSAPRHLRWLIAPALAVVGAVPWLLAAGGLPNPVATHFGPSGHADGHMAPAAAALVIGGSLAAALAWLLWLQRRGPRFLAIVAAYTAALLAGVTLSTAVVNHGIERWEDAHLAWWWVVVVILAGVPVGALAGWLQPPDPAAPRPQPADPMPLADTERVAWTGTAEASPVLWLPAVVLLGLGLPGLVAGVGPADAWLSASLLLTAVVLLWFTSVRVRVDHRGIEVRPGLVPWPRVRIPLAEVEATWAEDLQPVEWGGWGYRGSLRVAKRAAWVLRRGDGLVLDLTGDRRFAVTVDGAAEAASVVSGLVARAEQAGRT